jgi:SAM-dependent methyltransferase
MAEPRNLDFGPEGPEGWAAVWREDLRYPAEPPKGLIDRFFDRLRRKLVTPMLEPLIERQRNFNLVSLDLLRDARAHAEALAQGLRGDLDEIQQELAAADANVAGDVSKIGAAIPVAVQRNDALFAALDQKIEALAVRFRDLTNATVEQGSGSVQRREDFLYRRLEDGLRGSDAEVSEALKPYAELAGSHAPLVDIGCGRGELLALCREANVEARGFDTNERSVADLRARGFTATVAGVPGCFDGEADGSIGSVAAIHVVEHLDVPTLVALFRESHRVLRQGGLLMIETPNAESLAMTGSDFWRDPTHLAPRHPAALTLLAREHGFAIEEIRAVHPYPDDAHFRSGADDSAGVQQLVDSLNRRFFAGQDLRLILSK